LAPRVPRRAEGRQETYHEQKKKGSDNTMDGKGGQASFHKTFPFSGEPWRRLPRLPSKRDREFLVD
jgi:hypothetical protein